MHRRKVVVLDLAELDEAGRMVEVLVNLNSVGIEDASVWGTHFSQDLGAYSTSRSITISPTEVSSNTDIATLQAAFSVTAYSVQRR